MVIPLMMLGCEKEPADIPAAASGDPVVAAALASRPADPVDLTQFLKAFESADSNLKLYADETVAVIRTRNFPDALEQLGKLSRNPKLTPAQRSAIADVSAKLQSMH
jgi:hypothetical protein